MQNKHIRIPNIHALSGIQTHDPSVRVSKDSSCLRLHGYCDWQRDSLPLDILLSAVSCLVCCAAKFRSSRGTYELPRIYLTQQMEN
jgi:hypothetical protein